MVEQRHMRGQPLFGFMSAFPYPDQRPESMRHDIESWVQTWVQSFQILGKKVYDDATLDMKNQYVRTSASVSGPEVGGSNPLARLFKSHFIN
jgi:hypothetical protein